MLQIEAMLRTREAMNDTGGLVTVMASLNINVFNHRDRAPPGTCSCAKRVLNKEPAMR